MRIVDKLLANMSKEEIGDLLIEIENKTTAYFGSKDNKLFLCNNSFCRDGHHCIDSLREEIKLTEEERYIIKAIVECSAERPTRMRRMKNELNYVLVFISKNQSFLIPVAEVAFCALDLDKYYDIDDILAE